MNNVFLNHSDIYKYNQKLANEKSNTNFNFESKVKDLKLYVFHMKSTVTQPKHPYTYRTRDLLKHRDSMMKFYDCCVPVFVDSKNSDRIETKLKKNNTLISFQGYIYLKTCFIDQVFILNSSDIVYIES